jgi:hypothetical protein
MQGMQPPHRMRCSWGSRCRMVVLIESGLSPQAQSKPEKAIVERAQVVDAGSTAAGWTGVDPADGALRARSGAQPRSNRFVEPNPFHLQTGRPL